jgi:hypothetical protein
MRLSAALFLLLYLMQPGHAGGTKSLFAYEAADDGRIAVYSAGLFSYLPSH